MRRLLSYDKKPKRVKRVVSGLLQTHRKLSAAKIASAPINTPSTTSPLSNQKK